jgi:hypothetical protein
MRGDVGVFIARQGADNARIGKRMYLMLIGCRRTVLAILDMRCRARATDNMLAHVRMSRMRTEHVTRGTTRYSHGLRVKRLRLPRLQSKRRAVSGVR